MLAVDDLINAGEPAIRLIREWAAESPHPCRIVPPSSHRAALLSALQVTTRSPLGALVYETGGLLVEHGWLRILGSGHDPVTRDIVSWNRDHAGGFFLVADDAAGGFFAMNGGDLGPDMSAMYYWAPDDLEWLALEIGFPEFLHWSLSSGLDSFYARLRWPSWREDVALLSGDECFSFDPPLWTTEGSVAASRRTKISVAAAFELKMDAALRSENWNAE